MSCTGERQFGVRLSSGAFDERGARPFGLFLSLRAFLKRRRTGALQIDRLGRKAKVNPNKSAPTGALAGLYS
jgi:hypothetical protein